MGNGNGCLDPLVAKQGPHALTHGAWKHSLFWTRSLGISPAGMVHLAWFSLKGSPKGYLFQFYQGTGWPSSDRTGEHRPVLSCVPWQVCHPEAVQPGHVPVLPGPEGPLPGGPQRCPVPAVWLQQSLSGDWRRVGESNWTSPFQSTDDNTSKAGCQNACGPEAGASCNQSSSTWLIDSAVDFKRWLLDCSGIF